jgi:hypothetical protein
MKRIYIGVVCAFALAALPTLACADLRDPFYKEAKKAYMKHDCEGTLTYLAAYRHKDAEFLARNPEISAQISGIEAFCYAQAHRGLPPEAGTVTGQGAPPGIYAPGAAPSGNAGAPPPPYSPGTAPPSGTLMPPIVPPK